MKIRPRILLLCGAMALLVPRPAVAAEPEAVRFEIEAPPGCVDEVAVREEIRLLGGSFRDANLDDRPRTFRIEATQDERQVVGRLVVEDLVFRRNVREVRAQSCLEATRSLALFAATALDEAPPTEAPAPSEPPTPTPAAWPAPARETDRTLLERAPRRGSGGFTIAGLGSAGTSVSAGFRASAVFRVGGTTRIGLAGAVVHDNRTSYGAAARHEARGISNRVGALFGWGAPWNDNIIGFSTELGVFWGEQRGSSSPRRDGNDCWSGFAIDCYDETRKAPARWSYGSPYVAPQIVLQLPFKAVPVRPIASLGLLLAPIGPGGSALAVTGETGIVWQAW